MSSEEKQMRLCPACSAPLAAFSITVNGVEQPATERCTNQSCECHRDPAMIQRTRDYIVEIHQHQREMEKLKTEGKPIPTLAEWKQARTQPQQAKKRGEKQP